MVGNGKLINKTQGGFDNPQIEALIGKAIQKKVIPFSYKQGVNNNNIAQAAQNSSKLPDSHFALNLTQNGINELPMDNAEVKKALKKKDKTSSKKKDGKSKEKKEKVKTDCHEPEILVDSTDGSILKSCSSANVSEWRSLALLGKLALQDKANLHRENYNKLF